ncbi:hypothetical protein PlfCFBP13513_19030 [Plantibacter flavus]|uniref:alpha/beta hydrolase n=1 Tax=Plantibacter TaxID=190323 RepID=UPI0010C197D6|nr:MULTISPECIES: alpha/beta fold hydrolase [Plantibacter]MBD8104620.1 alpha/beta fold hydrolase [Plantibacter sp. CFBP 8775]MBD8535134.1 alpha/beta fold hydrolase [Plantibacter sp. CFBP 13570]TKJ95878.1 hypothetical protein PlfCFBP13513_19030 [Plantibacter flavus]
MSLRTAARRWAPVAAISGVLGTFHPAPSDVPDLPLWPEPVAERITVRSGRDGVRVACWFLDSTGPHCVVVMHGLGQTAGDVARQCEAIRAAGHHVVVFELRNHGRSDRRRRFMRMSDRQVADLAAVVDRVRSDPRVTGRIGLFACSFSTWAATRLAATGRAGTIDALVCDSGPERSTGRAIGSIVARRAEFAGRTPAQAQRAGRFAEWFARTIIAEPDWPPPRLTTPSLFLVGRRDRVISAAEVRAFAARYPTARCTVDPRAAHLTWASRDPERYDGLLRDHFDAHLGEPARRTECGR